MGVRGLDPRWCFKTVSKVGPFENAPFLVLMGEDGEFDMLSLPPADFWVWTIGENVSKSMCFRMKRN